MIKAVILDFYGVVQTGHILIWSEHYIAKQPELQAVFDDISHRYNLDIINKEQHYSELAAAASISLEELEAELAKELVINRPLLQVADQLRQQGIKVVILSNDGSSLRDYIQENNIDQHVDQVFISGELGLIKPDVRIYQHVINELNIEPAEAIFFDDRQENIDGAIRAGLQAEQYKSVVQVRKLLS